MCSVRNQWASRWEAGEAPRDVVSFRLFNGIEHATVRHQVCCVQVQMSRGVYFPAPLCPDLLCNTKNWREADSGGYRLWSLNVYFQPLFLIVWRSRVDVHICLSAPALFLSACPDSTRSGQSSRRESNARTSLIKRKQRPSKCGTTSAPRAQLHEDIKAFHVFYCSIFQPGGRNSAVARKNH